MNRIPKNHTETIFASSEHLFSAFMELIRDSKKKYQSYSISFLLTVLTLTIQKFQVVCMDDIPSVEDKVRINIFIFDIDFIDGAMVGELSRRSIKKYEKNVQLIRYNSHICYVDNIHALFNAFRCPTCDTYFQKSGNLERHLIRCSERVKQIYPKNVYQIQKTLFVKLDSYDIQYTDDQKLFEKSRCFQLWVYLYTRRKIQKHRDDNLDW